MTRTPIVSGAAPNRNTGSALTDPLALLPELPTVASTLVEAVHGALGSAIADGRLTAGYQLRETDLAAHFGCSTTPIREALRRLESEGLVRIHPRRTAEVTGFDTEQVRHLYEARLALEPYAVRCAVERGPADEELAAVQDLLLRQDRTRHMPLGADFHSALVALSGNPEIVELVHRVTRQIEAVQSRIAGNRGRRRSEAHRAHRELLTAVRDGDPANAESMMREHLEWARNTVLAELGAEADRADEVNRCCQ